MRLAVFSDVHGNLTALKAVLESLSASGPYDRIICAGDLLNKGPSVRGVIEALRHTGCTVIAGNHELLILKPQEADPWLPREEAERNLLLQQAEWTRSRLTPEDERWLRSLPDHIEVDPGVPNEKLFVCHASPATPWVGGSKRMAAEEMVRLYSCLPDVRIVVCGHDHGSFVVPLPNRIVVNVSSVSQHYGTRAEATYGEFLWSRGHWTVELHSVPYCAQAELARIKAVGMPPELERGAYPLQPIYEVI